MSRSSSSGFTAVLGTEHLTEDERHRLLAVEERRLALETLEGQITSIALEDLAVEIATRREGVLAAEAERVDHLTTMLHHAHLPVLDELDVVEYNPETNVVTPRTDTC